VTALYQYAQAMFTLLTDDEIGRSVPVTSLTTTTVVANQLIYGGLSSQKFAQKYMWRPLTAQAADRVRYIDSYTPSTGTLTHSGTNYADTTATSEVVLITKYEPQFICDAIQRAIQMLRRMDRTEFPVVMGGQRIYLGDLDWVYDPDDVALVKWNRSPVITRNRYLQKKNKVDTSGTQLPDWWTVTSNADTTPFTAFSSSTTPSAYRGQRTYYNLQRSGGTDAVLTQIMNGLRTGVSGDAPAGETVTAVLVCYPTADSDVNLFLGTDDATIGTDTNTVLEAGVLAELTTSGALPSTSSSLLMKATSQTNNDANIILEAYALIGTLDDAVRRDDYPEYDLPRADRNGGFGWEWDDQAGTLAIRPQNWGRGQILVYSKRPYSGFDADRLASGSADQDVSDAPLIPVATGALWKLFESHGDPRAEEWRGRFERLATKHLNAPKPDINDRKMQRLAPAARRFG